MQSLPAQPYFAEADVFEVVSKQLQQQLPMHREVRNYC